MKHIQRYPLNMHKGQHPNIISCAALDAADEKALAAQGFSTQAPAVPEPEEPKPVLPLAELVAGLSERILMLEDRVQEMADELTELKSKRPGAKKES